MKTKTKIIIGGAIALFLIVFAIAVVGGGFYYLTQRFREPVLRAKLDKAIADGKAFGKTTDKKGCMEKGFTLVEPTDIFDLSNEEFDQACLSASGPTPDFCVDVKLDFGGRWPEDQCKNLEKNTKACIAAYSEKLSFCRMENGM